MIDFIGPLPPPVHGFSWVSQQVLYGLRRDADVRVWNRALPRFRVGRRVLMPLVVVIQFLGFFFNLCVARPVAVYLACSGGGGVLLDCPFVILARCFDLPVYVHHHAFSYLNSPSGLARLCIGWMRNCQHIVLCEHMGVLLARKYAISASNIAVLTNAAFLDTAALQSERVNSTLTVGFLSNITVEKGILDFFDLAARFSGKGDSPQFLIAGPVADSIREVFDLRLKDATNVRHIGPVYGEAKEYFFQQLDLLAFPTRYPNEAEPVTILEAFRASVPVIANHRGCIATMLDEASGLGVVQASDFSFQAAELLKQLHLNPERLQILKRGALQRFLMLQSQAAAKLEWLLQQIKVGAPVGGR